VRIVNCARGGLVDEAALAELLKSGHVAGAAFDVFKEEPATENPLFNLPNVVVTPHLGASTTEAQENVALQVAEQMSDYLLTGCGVERAQHAVGHGRRGADHGPLAEARRASGRLRGATDRGRDRGDRGGL
jgi:phosphoglycerate dehydrogenase-like enzyme